jgi:putative flippase GtrA
VVVRLWRSIWTPQGKKVLRYATVSAVSAGVSFLVLGVVFYVFRWWTEVPSTLFANVVAGFPSYYLNRRWVWGKSGRSRPIGELTPFWVMSITSILFALVTASLARDFSNAHHLHHLARTIVVEGANIAAFGTLWILKFLLFNRLFRTEPAVDIATVGPAEVEA